MRKLIKSLILEELSKDENKFYGINSGVISYLLDNPGTFSKLTSGLDNEDARDSVESWCIKNIGPRMGKGYSRLAFSMRGNNDLVFKVSYIGEEGDETNRKEIDNFTRFNFQNTFFPRVFARDPSGEWLIVEKLDLLIEDGDMPDAAMTRFDPHIRKNVKSLKNIESLLRSLVQNEEDSQEKYEILASLPNQSLLTMSGGENMIAYYYFDIALKLAWDKDIWEMEAVRDFQMADIFDYFQGQHADFLERLCRRILKDPWMKNLSDIVKQLGIDWGDIGPGNIGVDEQGRIKILDISIFEERFTNDGLGRPNGTPVSWG
jgi:hypothetical protein